MSFGTSSIASYVSHVARSLEQLDSHRKQQVQVEVQAGESVIRARQNAVEQSMQDSASQAERVNEIKSAGLKARGAGGIDVWA